jgi:LysR family transcriptional regulator for metE and metH
VLAVPRGHSLAHKKYVEGADLTEQTLIMSPTSQHERDRVKNLLFGEHGGVKHVLRLPVTEAVLDLVQAGMGVSILAGFTLGPRIQRGELAAVRLTKPGLKRAWSGVFPKGSRLEGPIRTLLGTLKRHGLPRHRG